MKEKLEGTFSSVIPANHYGILYAEFRTGIVTDCHGHRVHGNNIQYLILTSLNDARSYARQKVIESPEIECVILDDKKEEIDLIKNTEYISRVMDEARRRNEARRTKRPWWKLW
ncbi:MAG: hypothetical protein HONDAALG_04169 [Gammaproteobacteria bacterium]|nr:hypothetical protein [Gammaproteobacteria bacterium]